MKRTVLGFLIFLSAASLLPATTVEILRANCDLPQVEVHYNAIAENIVCNTSYDLTSITASGEPQVIYSGANQTDLYTLIMADPDAPSSRSPSLRYWLHWLVVNIKVTNIKGSDLIQVGALKDSAGETLVKYAGPSPPAGSGNHRYYFYLFRQNGPLQTTLKTKNRGRFDVVEFAVANDLYPEPVALNMFYTQRNA